MRNGEVYRVFSGYVDEIFTSASEYIEWVYSRPGQPLQLSLI